MTDLFKEREKGEELKFGLDQQHEFFVRARRTKLFAQWLAENLGKTGDSVERYVKELISVDVSPDRDPGLIEKILSDLTLHNMTMTKEEINIKLKEFEKIAEQQITAESY